MNIESIDYTLLIYSFLCILLGMFICWIYMKKSILVQLTEKETIQETFNIFQNKYEILQLEKNEIDKQVAILKQEVQRISEIEQNLELQQKEFSALQVLNATLEERLESKENESREKLKFLEEAKILMGTEFENLSTKIFETKSKQFTEVNKDSIQNLLNPIQTKKLLAHQECKKYFLLLFFSTPQQAWPSVLLPRIALWKVVQALHNRVQQHSMSIT